MNHYEPLISIINLFEENAGRKTPNPNVLLELGYAAACIGWDKILLIYNRDYGRVDDLPFDLKSRRPIFYNLSNDSVTEKNAQKKYLSSVLSGSIYEISKNVNLVEDHIVTKMYPFYQRTITNMYLNCEFLLNDMCDYFKYEHPDSDLYPPDRNQITDLVNIINNNLADLNLYKKKIESQVTEPSERIINLFTDFIHKLNNNIDQIIKFKEGLDASCISILGKLLAYNNVQDFITYNRDDHSIYIETPHDTLNNDPHFRFRGMRAFTSGSHNQKIVTITYCAINAERFIDILTNTYELKNIFSINYSLHRDEYYTQEIKRNAK